MHAVAPRSSAGDPPGAVQSAGMSEPTGTSDGQDIDPDGDPGNLNPRDTVHEPDTDAPDDPDGDPGNLNPRSTLPD